MEYNQHIARSAVAVFVALDQRDQHTSQHCGRVLSLAFRLGRECALSERELKLLRISAAFHDVGKIGIPDSVLTKAAPFNDDDWAIMKAHPAKGQRIMLATELEDGDVVGLAVRHHHERYDGWGYPDGLAGEAIPILARILAIVDAYDAMASARRYGTSRSHHAIMKILQDEQGLQHDPWLYTKFARFIDSSELKAPPT